LGQEGVFSGFARSLVQNNEEQKGENVKNKKKNLHHKGHKEARRKKNNE